MKKSFLSLILFLFIFSASYATNDYKSIEEVKTLNYQLFEEIGLDENKINYVCRVIYSAYKKAEYLASNGAAPQAASESLDKEVKNMLLRVLNEAEYKKSKSVKHKLK